MKKSIKKRNVCLIACAVAVVVCLALFVQFAAKPLLNQMFYDPQKSTYEKQTSNFGICLAAYTELHCPGKQFYRLTTKNTGIGSYDLTINKRDFNGEQQAVMMSVNNEPDQKTSLSITGRESQKDVYLKLDLRQVQLVIQAGDGIRTFKAYRKSFFRNVLIRSEEIRSGTKVEIRTVLDPDYSDLEVVSTYDNFKYSVTGKNKITFYHATEKYHAGPSGL